MIRSSGGGLSIVLSSVVTLQIPGEKLSPNNMTGVYIEEPSVLVKNHNEGSQTWTMDKLNCRLDDMV